MTGMPRLDLLLSSPDPCRLVNFLGFAGLAVYCRNAAIHNDGSNSGRGRRALETALLTHFGSWARNFV
jgi:hypothetical protein